MPSLFAVQLLNVRLYTWIKKSRPGHRRIAVNYGAIMHSKFILFINAISSMHISQFMLIARWNMISLLESIKSALPLVSTIRTEPQPLLHIGLHYLCNLHGGIEVRLCAA
jgi:hypothetical protein